MITKKSQLKDLLPYGMVATRKWLLSQGVNGHLLDNALKSEKIQLLATGVYARIDAPISGRIAYYSLQKMSEQDITVGGITAVELKGFAHYLSGSKLKNSSPLLKK